MSPTPKKLCTTGYSGKDCAIRFISFKSIALLSETALSYMDACLINSSVNELFRRVANNGTIRINVSFGGGVLKVVLTKIN